MEFKKLITTAGLVTSLALTPNVTNAQELPKTKVAEHVGEVNEEKGLAVDNLSDDELKITLVNEDENETKPSKPSLKQGKVCGDKLTECGEGNILDNENPNGFQINIDDLK